MGNKVRKFVDLSPPARRAVIRRRIDWLVGTLLLGHFGRIFNRSNRFAYLSYVPDAVREFGTTPELRSLLDSWTEGNRQNAGDVGRLHFLVQNAEQVLREGVPGDFAEVGVYKGNSAKALAKTLSINGSDRKLCLFDTFDGFDERDLTGIDGDKTAIYGDTSLAGVRRFVGYEDLCEYFPGYFPQSASGVRRQFALVHLDCDLYEPIRASLEFFYYQMRPGALMVIHDYSSGHWPGVPAAVDEFLAARPERIVRMPDKSGTAIFRKT